MPTSKTLLGVLLAWTAWVGPADAQYVTDTTLGFEAFCGTPVPDAEFDSPTVSFRARALDGTEFAECGIESIEDNGVATGEGPHLVRPSLSQPVFDPLQGVDGTALIGNVGTGVGSYTITFSNLVNRVSFRVVDVETPDSGSAPFVLQTVDGSNVRDTRDDWTWDSDVVHFDATFPNGIKRITLDYGGFFDNWAMDWLQFNTDSCGDAEKEASEACDDGNDIQCDGCRNDCTTGPVGCLVDGACVADGSLDPESDGCSACDQPSSTPAAEVVGYNRFKNSGASCTDDGLECTGDTCNGVGACTHPALGSFCAIDGACYVSGDRNPGGGCGECDASIDKTTWTPLPMGTPCDDGDACTEATPDDGDDTNGDVCNDRGQCVAGQTLRCDDGLRCTIDDCDPDVGCVFTLANGCLIADAAGTDRCRGTDETNPDAPCQVCHPQEDDTAWSLHSPGERCGEPVCESGVLMPTPACDDAGTCAMAASEHCDGGMCADDSSCTGHCEDDRECRSENFCNGGECKPDKKPGQKCQRSEQCGSGFCTDGVCCDAACDRSCESCSLEGGVGVCTPHARGTDPDGDCPTRPEVQICDGASQCVDADLPDGTECSQAGECESGHCVDGVCCETHCDGLCESCSQVGREGVCRPHALQTDPEGECPEACNGAGECVSVEVRGNGLCTPQPGRRRLGWRWMLLGLAGLGGLAWWRRRERRSVVYRNARRHP